MSNGTSIGQMVSEQPEQARAAILALLRANGGNASQAARSAGVSYMTWTRWVRALAMGDSVEAVRRDAGFPDRRRKR